MDSFVNTIRSIVESPYFYVNLVLMMLFYQQQATQQRKLFALEINTWRMQFWRALVLGLAISIPSSIAMNVLQLTFDAQAIVWLWTVSIGIAIISMRIQSLIFSALVLYSVQLILLGLSAQGWQFPYTERLLEFESESYLMIAAFMTLVESLLIGLRPMLFSTPLFINGRRGLPIGAYRASAITTVPLFVLMGANSFIAPLFSSFHEQTSTLFPRSKFQAYILIRALISAFVLCVVWIPQVPEWLNPIALVGTAIGYLLILQATEARELKRENFFVNNDQGLRVLAVLPGTAAVEMGIQVGERIKKVNGKEVTSVQQLHDAIQTVDSYCKMEVENLAGEIKFVQRGRFANDHHLLGMIFVPDEDTLRYVDSRRTSLLQIFIRTMHKVNEPLDKI